MHFIFFNLNIGNFERTLYNTLKYFDRTKMNIYRKITGNSKILKRSKRAII